MRDRSADRSPSVHTCATSTSVTLTAAWRPFAPLPLTLLLLLLLPLLLLLLLLLALAPLAPLELLLLLLLLLALAPLALLLALAPLAPCWSDCAAGWLAEPELSALRLRFFRPGSRALVNPSLTTPWSYARAASSLVS